MTTAYPPPLKAARSLPTEVQISQSGDFPLRSGSATQTMFVRLKLQTASLTLAHCHCCYFFFPEFLHCVAAEVGSSSSSRPWWSFNSLIATPTTSSYPPPALSAAPFLPSSVDLQPNHCCHGTQHLEENNKTSSFHNGGTSGLTLQAEWRVARQRAVSSVGVVSQTADLYKDLSR